MEGEPKYVKAWWRKVRACNWQHIEVRYEEEDDEIKFAEFSPVKELPNTDLSYLNKLLISKNYGFVFKKFFGVEGKLKEGDEEEIQAMLEKQISYTSLSCKHDNSEPASVNSSPKIYARYWIWTHHLWNGAKRDPKRTDVIKLAKNLNLSGFSLPCKPGIILVEGEKSLCKLYWDDIKTWGWQSIEIRHFEENLAVSDLRFSNPDPNEVKWEELMSCVTATEKRKNAVNNSEFRKYLDSKSSTNLFSILFKLGENSDQA